MANSDVGKAALGVFLGLVLFSGLALCAGGLYVAGEKVRAQERERQDVIKAREKWRDR